jgi:hypothetical protein
MAADDTAYEMSVIKAVQDLTRRVDESEQHADDERDKLRATMETTVAAMREDFWRTTVAIQRDGIIHRDEHIVERKERAADIVQRTQRQTTVDNWMGVLTILAAINLLALIVLIVTQAY